MFIYILLKKYTSVFTWALEAKSNSIWFLDWYLHSPCCWKDMAKKKGATSGLNVFQDVNCGSVAKGLWFGFSADGFIGNSSDLVVHKCSFWIISEQPAFGESITRIALKCGTKFWSFRISLTQTDLRKSGQSWWSLYSNKHTGGIIHSPTYNHLVTFYTYLPILLAFPLFLLRDRGLSLLVCILETQRCLKQY